MSVLKLRLIGMAFLLLSLAGLHQSNAQDNSENACPQRVSNEICIQVIVFARNPGNGRCCQFANPCSVPPSWGPTFFTLEACEAAGG
jgi:hypothetical protein